MKKRLLSLVLIISVLCSAACGKTEEVVETEEIEVSAMEMQTIAVTETEPPLPTPIPESMQPDLVQIRNICQLAVLKVYFHNVAKAIKSAASGFSGIGEQDREFWFEYSGYAEIGIDMSRVSMEFDGETVYVTLPPVELINGVVIDSSSYNLDSVVVEGEDWYRLNHNNITADDLTSAINEANYQMQTSIMANSTLMMNAQQRAEDLIENYIQQIAKCADTTYNVVFVPWTSE